MSGDEVADRPRGTVGGRHLPTAIVVGVVLAFVFLGSLFWRSEAFTAVIAAVAVIAYIDADRVVRPTGRRLLTTALSLSAIVMMVATLLAGAAGQLAGVVVMFGTCVLALLRGPDRTDAVGTLATSVFFGLWVGFLASYGVLLVDRPEGPVIVLGVIGAAALTDIGGYGFGVWLGRHKVAPTISPNKSWEGLIGGLVVASVVAALVLPLLSDGFTPMRAALLAAVCGVAAFLGDLTESMVKRDLGVKDLGDLLPGHGGMLDRVDGILFALPVGYYLVTLAF